MKLNQSLALSVLGSVLSGGSAHSQLTESYRLFPNDAAAWIEFGLKTAVSDEYVVIGAHNSDRVYIFNHSGDQLHMLTPADSETEWFGHSVDISGSIVAIGASSDDDFGNASGSVYIYDAASGIHIWKLYAPDARPAMEFGYSVAIEGDVLAVGVPYSQDIATRNGAVYIYDLSNGSFVQKLYADDARAQEEFGSSVAIHGRHLAVGATRSDNGAPDTGAAYLFDLAEMKQLHKLSPADREPGDQLGLSIDIDANTVIVGCHRDDDLGDNSGSSYLFDIITGSMTHKLTAPDGGPGDDFGVSVAISNGLAVVGASGFDEPNNETGTGYVYHAGTGNLITKIVPDPIHFQVLEFGSAVSIYSDIIAVGSPRDRDNGVFSGSAFLYLLPCLPDTNRDGELDPTDFTAWIDAYNVGDLLSADQNRDGIASPTDFTAWIANYNAGCPQ